MVTVLLTSLITTGFLQKVSAEEVSKVNKDFNKEEIDINDLEDNLYNRSLIENPDFESDLLSAKFILDKEIIKQNSGEVSAYGMLGGGLKGLKAIGTTVKHGGNTLSWILKPFSRKVSVVVKRNSRKIASALSKPQKVSKTYVKQLLRNAGVSKSDTDTIVWWIFMIL